MKNYQNYSINCLNRISILHIKWKSIAFIIKWNRIQTCIRYLYELHVLDCQLQDKNRICNVLEHNINTLYPIFFYISKLY